MKHQIWAMGMVCLIGIAGFLLLTSCLGEVEERSPFPDIRFETTVHNFGQISQGAKAAFSYEFKNGGVDTLRITKVRKGCGCQSAKASRDVIPPGEKGTIDVVFTSRGYSGVVTKTVYVHSNDPEEERVGLVMKGTVNVDLIVTPRAVHFGHVPIGQSKSRKAQIVLHDLESLELKNIEVSADYVTLTTSDYAEANKKGYEITATLGSDAPLGKIEGEIKIATDSKQQPVILFPVHGTVFEPVVVTPEKVNFRVKTGESTNYIISVDKSTKSDFKITKIQNDLMSIKTDFSLVSEENDIQRYEIRITADPLASPSDSEGTLSLRTNDPRQSKIDLEMSGTIE